MRAGHVAVSVLVAGLLVLVGAVPALAQSASGSPPPEPSVTVTQADDGRTVTLDAGQVLRVSLTPPAGQQWQGPTTQDRLYLVAYFETPDATVADLQALGTDPHNQPQPASTPTPTASAPIQLTAHTDARCLHTSPACEVPVSTWSLTVVINGSQPTSLDYPCYANPSSSPAAGTEGDLTERDGQRSITVRQGASVTVLLGGCFDPWIVPTAGGPLFRSTASLRAFGANRTVFEATTVGTTQITARTDPPCFHVAANRCARPTAWYYVNVQVVPRDDCVAPTIDLPQPTIGATGRAPVVVTTRAGADVRLFAYTRPSTTFRQVRAGTAGQNGTVTFEVVPPANTRLYAVVPGCEPGPSVVLNVETTLTLTAERLGVRTYRFAGDSLPARPGGLIVSLYRLDGAGREVLTAQTRAGEADGEWSLTRTFTGTGRFGLLVRTGQDLQNAPGRSNVRPTLIF